ncbi:hypothetical protein ACJIZ3_002750 [Penstemon smallii]|uniref:BZIP domain-containing protein n=1 Tax=Penstemon smallii TaxID=265156 RepID=A0ABD3UAL7_9LAMI
MEIIDDDDAQLWKDLNLNASPAPPPPPSFSLTTPNFPGRKRDATIDENTIDRKRKRLIKNREAAVRSRARRQAYTYELEYEVAHLLEENAKLKTQIEKLCVAALANHHDEHPKKQKLYRTVSSPF